MRCRLAAVAILGVFFASGGAVAGPTCSPGEAGCIPTPEECATGQYNGLWDGGAAGRLAVCVSAGGHTVAYAGGNGRTQCGTVIVADQRLAGEQGSDPNGCSPIPKPPAGRTYVEMPDGVELAVYLTFPRHWDGTPLPVILEYDGYEGGANIGSAVALGVVDTDHYVIAHAGVRGTGCSGGRFSLFSEQSARDGADLVEWLGAQPWSNGSVGIYGQSYAGIMGLLVAAQRPAPLRAITVSSFVGDLYRDIVRPGGVHNPGFPLEWLAIARPQAEHQLGTLRAAAEYDTHCAANIASRPPEDPTDSAYPPVLLSDRDNDWFAARSAWRSVPQIAVPTQIQGQFQDEVVLGRGPAAMWERLDVAQKQLLLTNGTHEGFRNPAAPDPELIAARMRWLDRFVRGIGNGIDRQPRVRVFLESHIVNNVVAHSGEINGSEFPLEQSRWTRLFGRAGGLLSPESADTQSGSDLYLNGVPKRIVDPLWATPAGGSQQDGYAGQGIFWSDGFDAVTYRTPPTSNTQIVAGPIVATLHARIYGADAEFMVQVADEDPEGNLSLLQRGFLKASHRRVDDARSWFDEDVMIRPWHPHTNSDAVTPEQPVQLDVEVWPVAFVVRPGHRIVMIVTSPPPVVGLDVYATRSGSQPVEIVRDASHPTSLLLPFVHPPPELGPDPGCGKQLGVFCAKPAA